MHVWSINSQQRSQEHTIGKRIVSSINGAEKTGQPHAKEYNLTAVLHHVQKLTQNGLKI